jgi:hypothetical protein
MLPGGTRLALFLSLLTVLALPAAADAAPAAATITACRSDSVTVAGKVALSGTSARRARGATLELRFQALPLFGLPRSGQWKKSGKKTRASSHEAFTGLGADSWVGVMNWRYKKGRKTVLSGIERSQPVRVGSSRGRASCTIAEGVKPVDNVPPTLSILPADENWHHAAAAVQLLANDNFSGVKSVSYSLDGGAKQPLANGSTFTIPGQGPHSVDAEATDVAGNTATRGAVVRVDAAPPTKPALSKPGGVTASSTPTFQWSPSTDSGSGMKGYVLIIKRGDGSIASFQTADANTTSVQSAVTLNEGETYTAVVTAVDNTADTPWTTDSDPITFKVDTQPGATGFTPASGTILSGGLKNGPLSIALDRPADSKTVTTSTVVLDRSDGSDPSYTVKCTGSTCTTIEVDLGGALAEGHYALRLNGVKGADEGVTFSGTANYAVPFAEDDSFGPSTSAPIACSSGTPATSLPYALDASDPNQTAFLRFDITGNGGWKMEALYGGSPINSITGGGPGAGFNLPIPIGGHTGSNLTFRLTVDCSNHSVSASNVFGSRNP